MLILKVNFKSRPSLTKETANEMKIGDLARRSSLNASSIRYYESLGILAPAFVTRLGALFCPQVRVEPVWQRIMNAPNVASGASRRLQHRDVMPALHQLITGAEPPNPAPHNNDALGLCRLRRQVRA